MTLGSGAAIAGAGLGVVLFGYLEDLSVGVDIFFCVCVGSQGAGVVFWIWVPGDNLRANHSFLKNDLSFFFFFLFPLARISQWLTK